MRFDRRVPVAIVGGGASGTILAAQLARRGIAAALIAGSGRAGKGVAYSTTEPAHLLNVRAEGMSAWAGEPDHFVRRFEAEGGDRRGFAQRQLFGRYLGEMLERAVESGHTELVNASASGAERSEGPWRVMLDDGSSIEADAVVLAIGNQEPETLRAFAEIGPRF
ncbi:MAG TPA: FAD/NAD(P)-binding protein, partial [Sphingomicrobium sp.]